MRPPVLGATTVTVPVATSAKPTLQKRPQANGEEPSQQTGTSAHVGDRLVTVPSVCASQSVFFDELK